MKVSKEQFATQFSRLIHAPDVLYDQIERAGFILVDRPTLVQLAKSIDTRHCRDCKLKECTFSDQTWCSGGMVRLFIEEELLGKEAEG